MRVNERYAFLPRKYHGDVKSELLYDMSGLPKRALASIGVIVTGKQIGRASCRERVSSPV